MDKETQLNQQYTTERGNENAELLSPPADVVPSHGVRERIVREATRLFSVKGYNGVSVREIVEAAGITKPTLYYYYQSKEHLFERLVVGTLEEFRRRLEEVVAQPGPTYDRLFSICRVHFDFLKSNKEQCRLTHGVYFSSERNVIPFDFDAYYRTNFELVRGVIAEGIESGELRAGDSWLITLSFIGSMHMFIMAMLHDPVGLPTEGLAEIVVDMVLNGLGQSRAEETARRQGNQGKGVSQ